MTLGSLGTAAASLALGALADRLPDRRLLVIGCAVLGGASYGLVGFFPSA